MEYTFLKFYIYYRKHLWKSRVVEWGEIKLKNDKPLNFYLRMPGNKFYPESKTLIKFAESGIPLLPEILDELFLRLERLEKKDE